MSRYAVKAAVLLLLAMLLPASRAHAQLVPIDGPSYELVQFLKDLDAAQAPVARSVALAEYEHFLADLSRLRTEAQAARAQTAFAGNSGIPNLKEVTEGIERYKQAIKRTEALEGRLFDALIEQTPSAGQAAIATARTGRATQRMNDILGDLSSRTMARFVDVEDMAEFAASDPAAKAEVRAALAKTAPERRAAARDLYEAQLRSLIAIGTGAESDGLASADIGALYQEAQAHDESAAEHDGDSNAVASQTEALSRRLSAVFSNAMQVVWKPGAAMQRAQWKAVVDAAGVLPPPRARRLVCQAAAGLLHHLPMWESHDDDLRMILSWKKAAPACRDSVRTAALEWVAADDAAIRASAKKYLAELGALERMPDDGGDFSAVADELSASREAAWKAFIHAIGPCNPPSRDETNDVHVVAPEPLGDGARDDTGGGAIAEEPESEFSEEPNPIANELLGFDVPDPSAPDEDAQDEKLSDERADGIPSAVALEQILRGLGVSEELFPLAEQVRADAVERWATAVVPMRQALGRVMDGVRRGPDGLPSAQLAAAEMRKGLVAADAAAAAAQAHLGDSLVAALGAGIAPAAASVLQLNMRLGDPRHGETVFWSSDNEWTGGLRLNPAEVLARASLPPAELAAATAVLEAAANSLEQSQAAYRDAANAYQILGVEREYASRMGASVPGHRALMQQQMEQYFELENAGARAVDSARAVGESAVDRMCAAVSPASAATLRDLANKRVFPGFYRSELLAARAVEELTAPLSEGDPGIACARKTLEKFYSDAVPLRERMIAISKEWRGHGRSAGRRESTLESVLLSVRTGDLAFQGRQFACAFGARLKLVFPIETLRKSTSLLELGALQGSDLR